MFVPTSFAVTDVGKLAAVMRDHSFATVVTTDAAGVPFASHVPILFFPERGPHGALAGHFARANPQWQHFRDGKEALVMFQGPHAYVSPSWYQTTLAVPTWNYVAVHAYGAARIVDDEQELSVLVQTTVEKYESARPDPWNADALPAEFKSKMMKGIVGFEIAISRLEGKFKLSQNRRPEDVAGVAAVLSRSSDPTEREVAARMVERVGS